MKNQYLRQLLLGNLSDEENGGGSEKAETGSKPRSMFVLEFEEKKK